MLVKCSSKCLPGTRTLSNSAIHETFRLKNFLYTYVKAENLKIYSFKLLFFIAHEGLWSSGDQEKSSKPEQVLVFLKKTLPMP